MLTHPGFSPIAFSAPEFTLFGHHIALQVHWYGLMYLIGFYGAWFLAVRRGKSPQYPFPAAAVSDLLFFGAMGVILGGRVGYTLFYNLPAFLHDPAEIFRIWKGGMSFHGGLLGVIVAVWLYARTRKLPFWMVMDFVAIVVPFGLGCGRIGNFINQELWGAPTSLPWGMVFPLDPEHLPRHPTMLYEAVLEGLVLGALLWWFSGRPRPYGSVGGLFLVAYGCFRVLVESVRLPDVHIGYLAFGWVTMGIVLSVPMILVGAGLMAWAYRREPVPA